MDVPALLIRSLMFTLSGDVLRCLMLSLLIRHFFLGYITEFSVTFLTLKSNCIYFFFLMYYLEICTSACTPIWARTSRITKTYWNIYDHPYGNLSPFAPSAFWILSSQVFFWFLPQYKIHFLDPLLLSASFPLYFACSLLNISWR